MTEIANVLLFDDFSNHCLANVIEPLRAANMISRRKLYEWRFYSLDGGATTSSSGMQVYPDGAVSDAVGDYLFVMPSYNFRTHSGWATSRALKSSAPRHRVLAGLDTGSWLLADAGLLEGYRATIHWEELVSFEEMFPDVDVVRERYVIDRDRITCSGAMASYELATKLISERHDPFLALEVEQLFMSLGEGGRYHPYRTPSGRLVQRAVGVMQENIEEPLSIAAVARLVGATQKGLEQGMAVEMKATPQAVYRRLRLAQARKLVLETDLKIAEIAGRCGYDNASAMTRAFREEFGAAPRDMRNGS